MQPRSGGTIIATGASPWSWIAHGVSPVGATQRDIGFVPALFLRLRSIELALRAGLGGTKFKTTGSRPWLKLYRRSAATKHNENKILVSGGIESKHVSSFDGCAIHALDRRQGREFPAMGGALRAHAAG